MSDSLEWRVVGNIKPFLVATIWDSIRPRGDAIIWYDVIWFSQLSVWGEHTGPETGPDRTYFFLVLGPGFLLLSFLVQSGSAWNYMNVYVGLPKVSAYLNSIVDYIIAMSKWRSVRGIIARLVFAASTYYIWQERNYRLFKNQRRSHCQIIKCSKSTVRLKLLACSFKKTRNVIDFVHLCNIRHWNEKDAETEK
nr:hypothetical protein [Tanacetum cinerariifolium]